MVDEQMDERGGGLGYIYGDNDPNESWVGDDILRTYSVYADSYGNSPQYLQAIPEGANEFLGWYDENGNLLYSGDTLDGYADLDGSIFTTGKHVFASFKKITIVNPSTKYTIKLRGANHGKVGFSSKSLSNSDQSITVSHGELVTIYANGDTGNKDSDYGSAPWWYYVMGFFTESNSPIKTFSDINTVSASYSFTATSNMTICTEFVYYAR